MNPQSGQLATIEFNVGPYHFRGEFSGENGQVSVSLRPLPEDDPELDPVVCRLIERLTEQINRNEPIDFPAVIVQHPEYAAQLEQVLPTLEFFLKVSDSVTRRTFLPSPIPTPAGQPAQILGDFRLVRQIGRGGMGVVYEAEQISLDRRVAVKVLPFAGALDERQLLRFKNEARAAAGLTHPNIVPVYSVGSEAGIHYYAMQYINGPTLAQVTSELHSLCRDSIPLTAHFSRNKSSTFHQQALEPRPFDFPIQSRAKRAATSEHSTARPFGQPISPDSHDRRRTRWTARLFEASTLSDSSQRLTTIAEWGAQIATGLEYAHAVGVIHRDIKPANLMLDEHGHVWITDFGLAQLDCGAGPTMTGDVIGTLRYMSPEQTVAKKGFSTNAQTCTRSVTRFTSFLHYVLCFLTQIASRCCTRFYTKIRQPFAT